MPIRSTRPSNEPQYSDVDIASAAIVLHSLADSGEMAAPRKGGQLADLVPTKC